MISTFVLVALAVVQIFFLFRVWTEVGILWCLACMVFPPLSLWIFYDHWPEYRGIFFTELALWVVLFLVGR